MKMRLWMVASDGDQSSSVSKTAATSASDSHALRTNSILIVEVIDDGPGFGAVRAEALFRPFYSDAGTGLYKLLRLA